MNLTEEQDFTELLDDEASGAHAIVHEFRIQYDSTEKNYHLFFEGDDDPLFYMPLARRFKDNHNLKPYKCGGKSTVIAARDIIKSYSDYDIEFCLFFVDRDFDDYLGKQISVDDQTYITEFYSVENYIPSIDSAMIFFREIVKNCNNSELQLIERSFREAFELFYAQSCPLMAWVLAALEKGLKPQLKRVDNLKPFICFEGIHPKRTRGGFQKFREMINIEGDLPNIHEILKWRRRLNLNEHKQWIRGKYEVWFFVTIIKKIITYINNERSTKSDCCLKLSVSLSQKNIFETFAGKIGPPKSLDEFLKNRLK